MLKASQVRTKRAAFAEASMSSTPASCDGWLPTTPIEKPSRRAKPQMMFFAWCSWTSKNSSSSTIFRTASRMSYGLLGLSGTTWSSSGSIRRGSSLGVTRGAVCRLFCGRNDIR